MNLSARNRQVLKDKLVSCCGFVAARIPLTFRGSGLSFLGRDDLGRPLTQLHIDDLTDLALEKLVEEIKKKNAMYSYELGKPMQVDFVETFTVKGCCLRLIQDYSVVSGSPIQRLDILFS